MLDRITIASIFAYFGYTTDIVNNFSYIEKDTIEDSSTLSCPIVYNSDFTTLGPPDIPHKIRVKYKDSDTYPVVSWESNDTQTTTLDYDGGNFGAYYHYNEYSFVDIKLTIDAGGTNCVSTHTLGWPQM